MKSPEQKAEEALVAAEEAVEHVWWFGALRALIQANRHTLAALKKHKETCRNRRSE